MAIRLFVKTVEPETALEPAKVTHEDVAELLIEQVSRNLKVSMTV